ncbi:hypothetical protein HY612_05360 [Candidatus Roizmanbacteria bacterium]|nr:hypothetical protein [Candidatus Roizmanbacteria bacterium]
MDKIGDLIGIEILNASKNLGNFFSSGKLQVVKTS